MQEHGGRCYDNMPSFPPTVRCEAKYIAPVAPRHAQKATWLVRIDVTPTSHQTVLQSYQQDVKILTVNALHDRSDSCLDLMQILTAIESLKTLVLFIFFLPLSFFSTRMLQELTFSTELSINFLKPNSSLRLNFFEKMIT